MSSTVAQRFLKDPRVQRAQGEILSVMTEYQRELTGVRPVCSALVQDYDKMLDEFGAIRAGKLFMPYLGSGLGHGALVELADGSIKYDFITGIGVHILGHSHSKVVAAALNGAIGDTIMQGNLEQNPDSIQLAKTLLDTANRHGAHLAHCFLTTSGVMAAENALKITFQKKHPASRLLAFRHCFMGRTLALSQATDKPAYREGLPKTLEVDYVPFFDAQRPKESTVEAVNTLKQHLAAHPGEYAAMCFELVLGEGGFYPGDREFFVRLMEVLQENGVAILVDEVQTFCRTTEPFAFQLFGLDAYVDVVWVGKAAQACATLFKADFKPRPGLLSQTYTASSTAISAGLAILEHLLQGDFYGPDGRIAQLHAHFKGRLEELSRKYPDKVAGPYGIGGMVAFTPFDGAEDKAKQLLLALYHAGVMSYYAGEHPTRLRFLMPVGVVTTQDIDAVVDILEKTLLTGC